MRGLPGVPFWSIYIYIYIYPTRGERSRGPEPKNRCKSTSRRIPSYWAYKNWYTKPKSELLKLHVDQFLKVWHFSAFSKFRQIGLRRVYTCSRCLCCLPQAPYVPARGLFAPGLLNIFWVPNFSSFEKSGRTSMRLLIAPSIRFRQMLQEDGLLLSLAYL